MLVTLALPGYVFQVGRRRSSPERTHTALQEILSILFVGVVIDGVILLLLSTFAAVTHVRHPDMRLVLSNGKAYLAQHLGLLTVWCSVAIVAAVLLAQVVALRPWWTVIPEDWRKKLDGRIRRREDQQSAWWLLFHEHPDAEIHVGCMMVDGSYLAGALYSYSRVSAEHENRELTIRGEILYRPPGEPDAAVLPDVNAVVISARQLAALTVSYIVPSPSPSPSAIAPSAA
jgi:Family of unknown function (DUF6338)